MPTLPPLRLVINWWLEDGPGVARSYRLKMECGHEASTPHKTIHYFCMRCQERT